MKVKELNLCELLKGCEGEKLYSISHGELTVDKINEDSVTMTYEGALGVIVFHSNGKFYSRSDFCTLYPSRALYEKYPLNAYSAWMEWKESKEPKRWRAKKYQGYYYIDYIGGRLVALYDTDEYDKDENNRYESYNYFRTKEEAQQAAEEIRKTLMKFYERKICET